MWPRSAGPPASLAVHITNSSHPAKVSSSNLGRRGFRASFGPRVMSQRGRQERRCTAPRKGCIQAADRRREETSGFVDLWSKERSEMVQRFFEASKIAFSHEEKNPNASKRMNQSKQYIAWVLAPIIASQSHGCIWPLRAASALPLPPSQLGNASQLGNLQCYLAKKQHLESNLESNLEYYCPPLLSTTTSVFFFQ